VNERFEEHVFLLGRHAACVVDGYTVSIVHTTDDRSNSRRSAPGLPALGRSASARPAGTLAEAGKARPTLRCYEASPRDTTPQERFPAEDPQGA
jgi:hypothetical protein